MSNTRYNLRKRPGNVISEYVQKRPRFFESVDDKDWTPRTKKNAQSPAKEEEPEKAVEPEHDEDETEEEDVDEEEDDDEDEDDDDDDDADSDSDDDEEDADDDDEDEDDEEYDDDEADEADEDDDEAEDADDEEEYYEYDKSALTDAITEKLSQKLAQLNIPKEDLKTAVEASMEKAQSEIFDGYCGNKPADTRWKAGLSEETVSELEPELRSIREEMTKETPSMVGILRARIPKTVKKKAVRLFDMLQNLEPFTEEYFETEDKIRQILELEKEYKDVNIGELEEEEKRLMGECNSSIHALRIRIMTLDANDSTKMELMSLFNKMNSMNPAESEYSNLRNKIDMAVSLPHRRMAKSEIPSDSTPAQIDDYCVEVRRRLDSHLYGMNEVKERLLEIVNNRLKNPSARSSVALSGGPGVGKTAIAQALAQSLNMPFDRISLGGMQDSTFLKGQDNSWVGASPSIILQMLRKMKYCNGIILFDEVDKLGDKGKEIQYALLHITDYIQNDTFQDMYLREFPHDLSKIWFMYAMNDETLLDPVLRDRLTIMKVPSYSNKDKMVIIDKYMLPSAVKNIGREPADITIDSSGCVEILSFIDSQKDGLRSIQKGLERLCSRINMLLTSGADNKLNLSYFIPGIKTPLVIDAPLVQKLWPKEPIVNTAPPHMYI